MRADEAQDGERVDEVPAAHENRLRGRPPGSAVIAQTLRLQAQVAPRTGVQRFFGRSPLSADTRSWYVGALGEMEVGRELERLGSDWTVLHAVPIGTADSDIDHLLVGHSGVYTVNTKHHDGGRVWLGRNRLLVNGQRTDHLRNARFEARRVGKLLSRTIGRDVRVTPIIALVASRSLTVKERPDDVVVLRSNELVRWLKRRPTLSAAEVPASVRQAVLAESTWRTTELVEPDLEGFAELQSSVASASRRRRGWAAASGVAALAGFWLLMLNVPAFIMTVMGALLP